MASSSESLQLSCPHCQTRIRLKDPSLLGRKIKCPTCAEVFRTPAPAAAIPSKLAEVTDDPWEENSEENSEEAPPPPSAAKKKSKTASHQQKSGKKKSSSRSLPQIPTWVLLISGLILVGVGALFIPLGNITSSLTRLNPLTDSYTSIFREAYMEYERYQDATRYRKGGDPLTDEEIKQLAEAAAKKIESLRFRALMIPYKAKEEVVESEKFLSEYKEKLGKERKVRYPGPGRERQVSTIETSLTYYEPYLQFALTRHLLNRIPEVPQSNLNSAQKAISRVDELENELLQRLSKISSTDQLASAVSLIEEKRRNITELISQIQKEAAEDPAGFQKQEYSFSDFGTSRLEHLEQMLTARDLSSEELRAKIQQFRQEFSNLIQAITDCHRQAYLSSGQPPVDPHPADPHPAALAKPRTLLPGSGRLRLEMPHQPSPANNRGLSDKNPTSYETPFGLFTPSAEGNQQASTPQKSPATQPPEEKSSSKPKSKEESPFQVESPASSDSSDDQSSSDESTAEESPFKPEK